MAIRFSNQYRIQTPINDLGSLQSAFSYSYWLQLNDSGVVAESLIGNLVFDANTISYNSIHLDLKGQVGGSRATVDFNFQLNKPYLLVGTWISGQQNHYVNGQLIYTDNISGPTISNSFGLIFGPSLSGIHNDVIISQPAIYSGQLSLQDTVNLLTNVSTPASLNAEWYVPFSGIINAPITSSDLGLSNLGFLGPGVGNKYNANVITGGFGSGWYVPDLVYTQPINVTGYITKNGLLTLYTSNVLTNNPSAITSVGTGIAAFVNGVQQQIYGPVYFNTLQDSPFVMYKFINPINISSVVTWSAQFGSITTVDGFCSTINSQPTNNYLGQLEPTFGGFSSFTPISKFIEIRRKYWSSTNDQLLWP